MFGFATLKSAILRLAGNITDLAATVKDIDVNLRRQAALDGPEPIETPTLTDMPIPASTRHAGASETEDSPTAGVAPPVASRNGRRKPVAATAE